MELTVKNYLYARVGKPSASSPKPYYHKPGDKVKIEAAVIGDEMEGISIWYKQADADVYLWSGGFAEVEFVLDAAPFNERSLTDQFYLISDAKSYYYPILEKKVAAFSGLSVAQKQTGPSLSGSYALTVQVTEKSSTASYQIPPVLPFRGCAIPTDVVQASPTTPSLAGEKINRMQLAEWGTGGLIVKKDGNAADFLVTNCHVLCHDLLAQGREIKIEGDVLPEYAKNINRNVMQGDKKIGVLSDAYFNNYLDIALVELSQTSTNVFPNNRKVMGPCGKDELLKKDPLHKYVTVWIYGAASKESSSNIISLNSDQPLYFSENGGAKITLYNLIQIKRLSKKGDSGSAVVTSDDLVIGILVADDNEYSYVIPISRILANLKITIK
jgi:hypothetical protein